MAPHEFADFVRSHKPALVLGSQHDAADFLVWLLQYSTIGANCCWVGDVERNEDGLITLNEIEKDSPQTALIETGTVDLIPFISYGLEANDTKLKHLPSLLLVRVPQFVFVRRSSLINVWVFPTVATKHQNTYKPFTIIIITPPTNVLRRGRYSYPQDA